MDSGSRTVLRATIRQKPPVSAGILTVPLHHDTVIARG